MSKLPFVFHVVEADWGKHLPDGDYTIGRGADPRTSHERDARQDDAFGERPDIDDDEILSEGTPRNRREPAQSESRTP